MVKKKRMTKRMGRALEKKKRIQREAIKADRIVEKELRRGAPAFLEKLTGIKGIDVVPHKVRGGIVFEIPNPKDYIKVYKLFGAFIPPGGFTPRKRDDMGVRMKELLNKGRVGFVPSYRIKRGTEEAKKHEAFHIAASSEAKSYAASLKEFRQGRIRAEEMRGIIRENILEELGAKLRGSPKLEWSPWWRQATEPSKKFTIEDFWSRTKEFMEQEKKIYKGKLIKGEDRIWRGTEKQLEQRMKLVKSCLDKGVPREVLSGVIITNNWGDLPRTLKKLFDVK